MRILSNPFSIWSAVIHYRFGLAAERLCLCGHSSPLLPSRRGICKLEKAVFDRGKKTAPRQDQSGDKSPHSTWRTAHQATLHVAALCLLLFLPSVTRAAETNPLQVAVDPGSVTISSGNHPVLDYCATAAPFKPYVRELFTPGGVQILRDKVPDHKHHHGLMFAVAVDGVNFWEEAADSGIEKPRGPCELATASFLDTTCTRVLQTLDWTDAHGKRLLVERREIGVVAAKSAAPVTLVLWNSDFSTAKGVDAVKLDGHHYFGLGMRFLQSMDSGGRFFNSANQRGETVQGSERLVAANWCAYTAKADGKPVTAAIFDHPSNPRHPNKIFTMTPPFAYMSATLNLWKEPLLLKAGSKLKLRYAVAVWDGETTAAQIESLYEKWRNVP